MAKLTFTTTIRLIGYHPWSSSEIQVEILWYQFKERGALYLIEGKDVFYLTVLSSCIYDYWETMRDQFVLTEEVSNIQQNDLSNYFIPNETEIRGKSDQDLARYLNGNNERNSQGTLYTIC